ncbi:MAG: TIGR02757 family protein [Flavobacteriales bacterium]
MATAPSPFRRKPSAARLEEWRDWLDEAADRFERPDFLEEDPLGIPHGFESPEDRAIAGFLAATLAWGNRKSILRSCHDLLDRMDRAPAAFVRHADAADLKRLEGFVHRTFQGEDALRFVRGLRSLEEDGGLHGAFAAAFREAPDTPSRPGVPDAGVALSRFKARFFRDEEAGRTGKHVADPLKGSAAKRLCMYLRWMVRPARRGVDLGMWTDLPLHALRLPLDVHTGNVARRMGLLKRKASDWRAVEEVTDVLRMIDPVDPVRYDFALFGLGVTGAFDDA